MSSSYYYQTPGESADRLADPAYREKYAQPKKGTSPWLKYGAPVAVLVILGAVLGGVYGSRAASDSNSKNVLSSPDGQSSSSSASARSSSSSSLSSSSASSGSRTSSSTAASTTAAVAVAAVKALPTWTWGTDKVIGMCLGHWLSLERWMDEDWMVSTAGPDAWDEWQFSKNLGPDKAAAALQAHYASFITEADFQTMSEYGINMLRIPMGFWAWIPTTGDEPYVNAGQVTWLEKAMQWAYTRGMYVIVDLHGLPGSQNGEQSSGHNTTSPSWFGNSANQARSDATVKAVTDWLGNHPYRSVVAAIEPGNEFRPYTDAQNQEMVDFYTRSYNTIQASAWPVAMGFHPGYFAKDPFGYFRPFAAAHATTPPSAFITDHRYPGNFPPQTDASGILAQVCTGANTYLGYPVPVIQTEYSLYTGVKRADFEKQFYESQITAWSWSGGALYWSWKLIPSKEQLSIGLDYSQYSFSTVITNSSNVITKPSASTTNPANAASYLSGLNANCGKQPSNAAPSNAAAPPAWSAQASALASASAAAASSTGHSRYRRAFKA